MSTKLQLGMYLMRFCGKAIINTVRIMTLVESAKIFSLNRVLKE